MEKTRVRKIITNGLLLLAGAFLAIGGLYIYSSINSGKESSKEKFVQEFTRAEQARLGIDCSQLRPILTKFLEERVEPAVKSRKEGGGQSPLINHELRTQLDNVEDYLFNCTRLYEAGDAGTLNGLQSLAFAGKSIKDFSVMATILKENMGPSEFCNEQCVNAKSKLLEDSYARLISLLKAS